MRNVLCYAGFLLAAALVCVPVYAQSIEVPNHSFELPTLWTQDTFDFGMTNWSNAAAVGRFYPVNNFGGPLIGQDGNQMVFMNANFSPNGWELPNFWTTLPTTFASGLDYRLTVGVGGRIDSRPGNPDSTKMEMRFWSGDVSGLRIAGKEIVYSDLSASALKDYTLTLYSEQIPAAALTTGIGLWFSSTAGNTGGDWSLDNVRLEATDWRLRPWNPVPAHRASYVGELNNNGTAEVALSWNTVMAADDWTQVNPAVTAYYLYLAASEPNFVGADPIIVPADPSQTVASHTATLLSDKSYYWRVDAAINNSSPTDPNNITGPLWSFATVKSLPEIDQYPQDLLVKPGQTAEFSVTVISVTPIQYAWYKVADGGDNLMSQDATLTVPNVQKADEGYYYCVVTNAGGEEVTPLVRLAVERQVAHWTLDAIDYVDGQYLDTSGNGHHADPNGVPQILAARIGEGVVIDSANGWANAGQWNPSELSGRLSVSFWLKWDGPNGDWQTLIAKRADGSYVNDVAHWQISTSHNGTSLWFDSPVRQVAVSQGLANHIDQWVHVLATFDGTTGRIYLNGKHAAAGAFAYGNAPNVPIILGAANPAGQATMDGMLDDVQIFNYALSDLDAAVIYTTVSGGSVCLESLRPSLDLSGNCRVDLSDLMMLANQWLDCGLVPDCHTVIHNW